MGRLALCSAICSLQGLSPWGENTVGFGADQAASARSYIARVVANGWEAVRRARITLYRRPLLRGGMTRAAWMSDRWRFLCPA